MDFKRTRSHFHPRGPARRARWQTSIGPKRTSWRSGWRAAPDGGSGGLGRARVSQGAAARTYNPAHDDCHRLRRSTLMRRALDLARTVMYTTAPNPRSAASSCATDACWAKARPSRRAARTPRCAPCAMPRPVARRWRAPPSMSRWSRAAITAAPRPAWTPCWPPRRRAWWWRSATPIPGQRPGPGAAARRRHRRHHRRLPRGSAGAQRGLHLPHESRAALGLDEDGGFAGWPQRVA